MNNDEKPNSLPAGSDGDLDGIKSLSVDVFNYNPNSLTELRKIAESNPDLASKIVDSQTKGMKWANISEWFGIAVAGALGLTAILGFVAIVVKLGWWQSVAFLALLLCVSHVMRTLLTGEWSDTSWFGQFLKKSGAPPDKDDGR